MPAYVPTDWVDGTTPLNAANLDKLEAGVVAAERAENKGAVNGYAPLDESALIPVQYLPPTGDETTLGEWTFNATITAPPATGQARINNAAFASATLLWLHESTAGGASVPTLLAAITAGQEIQIQEKDNAENWVRYSVTADAVDQGVYSEIAVTFLDGGGTPPSPAQRVIIVQRKHPTAAGGGGAELVTSLPASPADGDEVIFTDSLTAPTYAWHLKYIAAKATNKWLFIGGSALRDEIATQQSTSSSAYVALGTAGPSIVIPVAGDYEVALGATISNATDQGHGAMSYDIGATAAADADYIASTASGTDTNRLNSAHRVKQKSLGAVTLTAKYRSRTTTVTHFSNRYMSVVPVAIGG